jgi:hypothetical protein
MGNSSENLQLEMAEGSTCRDILDLCQGNQQWPSMFQSNKVGCVIAVRLC